MKTRLDVQVEGSNYEISLSKLLDLGIKDIQGYISYEFGEPTFKMTKIILDEGHSLWCEGEHDFPYITESATPVPGFTEEALRNVTTEDEEV